MHFEQKIRTCFWYKTTKKLYYTLQSFYEENRTIYAPVEGHKHTIRPIISGYLEEMKGMEKLLLGEIAASLNMPVQQMKEYITEKFA